MRVLFFMRHPGYVRNFESALAELARRGHDVHVAFDSLNTKWMAGADPLGGLSDNERVTFDRAPRVRTGWQHLATSVRSCDDFLRYQRPEYANAPKLRKRAEERLPRGLRSLMASSHGPRLQSALRTLDRSMRLDPQIARYVRDAEPDIVLVTPLVGLGSTQADYLKAAHALGIPAGLCVASWDNLTNKGLIREHPELVAVWNDAQRREAVELHGTPEANVAVTGAHSYDHWFSWEPSSDRETFCARVGLDPERPYILYLGSSPFIAPQEHRHVTAWLRGLRDRPEPELQEVGVLIRPHPQNGEQWAGADLSEIGNVTVYPPSGADPVDRRRKVEYYDSIHHAALVVGVNTSAQIESAIVGRSVFCLLSEEFSDTQQGTLHFEHLAADDGGLLVLADNFDEHAGQLAAALRDPGRDDERRRRFLANFVRPFGLDAAGAPRLATAIELAAAREPQASQAGNRVLTALLAPVAFAYPGGKHSPFDVKAQVGRARRRSIKRLHQASKIADSLRRETRKRTTSARLRQPERDPQGRILFFLNYAGYLRYFDGVIRELAERGHTVMLVLDRPDKQAEGLRALESMPDTVRLVGTTPRRDDLLGPLARGLRGTLDYVRYLHPRFADAQYLRNRRRKALDLAPRLAPLGRLESVPPWVADILVRVLRASERAVPSDKKIAAFLAGFDPDLVVVSPLVSEASPQTDIVKSAQRLGIPTALCVASWDHLTTKGLIRVFPDRVIVWNETQAREARELHAVAPERVVVTGAQPFDRWFHRRPNLARDEFCARVGLPADRPFILFVGSTAGISRPDDEETFVRSWIAAVRSSGEPALRDASILIRPHPYNPGSWATADLTDLGNVAVWPRRGANPVDENDRHDYFDSMYHSAAVVGINTSAMIESAIIGRPVHTIQTEDFAKTQGGTLHFHYMLPENGGFLRVATSLEEHAAQLADCLTDGDIAAEQLRRFVGAFLRPHGLERGCTPILADELESLAMERGGRPVRVPRALLPVTALLYAGAIRRRYRADGKLPRDAMIAARRTSRAFARTELRLAGHTVGARLARKSLIAARRLSTSIELRASRRYRAIVPKIPAQPTADGAATEPAPAPETRIETTP